MPETDGNAQSYPRRVLFITLEYKAGTFSGNGIYSQSMVRSLSGLGHSVFVLSAGPKSTQDSAPVSSRKTIEHELVEIPVDVWGRLDWNCGWKEFAGGVTEELAERVTAFRPEWALVVDWSGLGAYEALQGLTVPWEKAELKIPRLTYLNYRVYTLSEYKGDRAAEEKQFYRQKEGEAVKSAWAVAALSTRDANFLQDQWGGQRPAGSPRARALLPPLREDIRQWAIKRSSLRKDGATDSPSLANGSLEVQENKWKEGRKYLSCCVRLSPEKNADLFATLVEQLAAFLEEHGVVPLICAGANSGDTYGQSIKSRVAKAAPSAVIIEGFLGPERMGELYSQTLLNIHPCLYDAYGMTMVEAAAFGAPSVVNVGLGGAVGATELLEPAQGLAFPVDLSSSPSDIAEELMGMLQDPEKLAAVGSAAAQESLSWSEEANARELTCIADATVA